MENQSNTPPSPDQQVQPPIKKWYQHKGLLAVIALAVIAAVAIIIYFQRKDNCVYPNCTPAWETPFPKDWPPQNATSSISNSDWQTYINTQYGFEFKYPSDWKIVNEKKVDDQTLLVLDFASPEENAIGKFTANMIIYSGDFFSNNLNDLVKVTEQVFGKMDNVTIAGEPGKKIIARSSGGTKKLGLKSAFMHSGLGYEISSTGWVADENKAVAEVDALLSTFKFTK